MAQWHDIQADFSGGEISTRMFMRAGTEVYEKSLAQMLNFMPSLSGTAQRTPGTKYVGEILDSLENRIADSRIIPFINITNQRGIVNLTTDDVVYYSDLEQLVQPQPIDAAPAVAGIPEQIPAQFSQNPNPAFVFGLKDWEYDPELYTFNVDNVPAGVFVDDEFANSQAAVLRPVLLRGNVKPSDEAHTDTCWIKSETRVIDGSINTGGIRLNLNLTRTGEGFPFERNECLLKIGTAEGLGDLLEREFEIEEVGGTYSYPKLIPLPGGFNGKVYIYLQVKAIPNTKQGEKQDDSIPTFVLRRFEIRANQLVDSAGDEVALPPGGVPWAASDLKDIHFIQSPYSIAENNAQDGRDNKALVLVHPNWPPHWIRYSVSQYILEPIPFTDNEGLPYSPPEWQPENYPSCCTSYHGRLMMAGGQGFDTDVIPALTLPNTEKVWGTQVGRWDRFSLNEDGSFEVNPDSSIEFTAKYRSPIQWLFGQKDLLVGGLEFEYIASGEGIFAPGDIGVNMHSSHGSNHVQPAALGDLVLFPAEGGTRVRAMGKSASEDGWIAPDMSLYNPDMLSRGITRMVTMRNPHQMVICLMESGDLSVLNIDSNAGLAGWHRMRLGNVKDICVTVGRDGQDILWLLVSRTIEGVPVLNLEVIDGWTDQNPNWGYLNNSVDFTGDYSTQITGLEHLNGKLVHVIGTSAPRDPDEEPVDSSPPSVRQQGYLGSFRVRNGVVELQDGNGWGIEINGGSVGLASTSRMQTLPMGGGRTDPGGPKRFSDLSVRVRASVRPRMGVVTAEQSFEQVAQRGDDRTPRTNMNTSEFIDILSDIEINSVGWDQYQMVVIQETLPIRCEILGIYGKITANSL